MRAIIVDDEPIMIRYFMRESRAFSELNGIQGFECAEEALAYAKDNLIEIAFLDIEMPEMSGLELAVKLRSIRPDVLIVFISAHDYVRDSNNIGGDYYLMKPYNSTSIKLMMDRINLLAVRQKKKVYMHMFGAFTITVDGIPVMLRGKAKEMLACIAVRRGKEVSGQTIFNSLWEGRSYSKNEMTLYYHTARKLKDVLEENGLGDLLIPTAGGYMLNTDMVTCDYFSWLDNSYGNGERFNGSFLTEYSWAEPFLSELIFDNFD